MKYIHISAESYVLSVQSMGDEFCMVWKDPSRTSMASITKDAQSKEPRSATHTPPRILTGETPWRDMPRRPPSRQLWQSSLEQETVRPPETGLQTIPSATAPDILAGSFDVTSTGFPWGLWELCRLSEDLHVLKISWTLLLAALFNSPSTKWPLRSRCVCLPSNGLYNFTLGPSNLKDFWPAHL